jgi:hypothetical protein
MEFVEPQDRLGNTLAGIPGLSIARKAAVAQLLLSLNESILSLKNALSRDKFVVTVSDERRV